MNNASTSRSSGQHGSSPGPTNQLADPQNQHGLARFSPAGFNQRTTQQSYYQPLQAPQTSRTQLSSRQPVQSPLATYSGPPHAPQGNYRLPVSGNNTTAKSNMEQRYHVSPQHHYQQPRDQTTTSDPGMRAPPIDPRSLPFDNGGHYPPHQTQFSPPQTRELQVHARPISHSQLSQSVHSDIIKYSSANPEQSLLHFSNIANHRNEWSRQPPATFHPPSMRSQASPAQVSPVTRQHDIPDTPESSRATASQLNIQAPDHTQRQHIKMAPDVHSPRNPAPFEIGSKSATPGLPSQEGAEDDGREHASNHAAAVVKNVKQALIVAMDLMQDHLADEFTRLNSAHLKIEKSLQSENAELRQRLGALNTECVDLARRANYWKVQNETLQANMSDMITRHNETLALLESKEEELKVLRSSVSSLEEEKVAIAKLPLVQQSALADNNKRKAFELEGQLKKFLRQIGDNSSEQHRTDEDEDLSTSSSPTVRGSPVTPKNRLIESKVKDASTVSLSNNESLVTRVNCVPSLPTINVDAKVAPPFHDIPEISATSTLPYPPPIMASAYNVLETDSRGQTEESDERPRKKRRESSARNPLHAPAADKVSVTKRNSQRI